MIAEHYRSFRVRENAAPLKHPASITHRLSRTGFRVRENAAPLKPRLLDCVRTSIAGGFRVRENAAPLKRKPSFEFL